MATRQYIGARYVPVIANPVEWSSANTYEPLTIVTHQGNSYTSRQSVPVGIDINNTSYWAETGNYNAQIEQYRQDTVRIKTEWDSWEETTGADLSEWKQNTEEDLSEWKQDTEEEIESIVSSYKDDVETTVKYDIPVTLECAGVTCGPASIGSYCQSALYVGNRLFSAGQGNNNNDSVICEFSTTTGQIINSNIVPEIGHANGMCTLNGLIYACNNNTIVEINANSLAVSSVFTFDIPSINSIFVKDDFIHCICGNGSIYKLNLSSSTAELLFTIPGIAGATQNSTYYNGKIYQLSTLPNCVKIIDFDTHQMTVRMIPNGDGFLPCCEVEGIFVKDGDMYITGGDYENSGLIFTLEQPIFMFIFKTNIINGFNPSNRIEHYRSKRDITVNGSQSPTFAPPINGTTYSLQLACLIANYIDYCHIWVTNFNDINDTISLKHCTCTIESMNAGGVNINNIECLYANVHFTGVLPHEHTKLISSNIYFGTTVILGEFYSYNTNIEFAGMTFTPSTVDGSFTRSKFKGSLANISPFESMSLASPQSQIDLDIVTRLKHDTIYLFNLISPNSTPTDGSRLYVTIMRQEATLRIILTGAKAKQIYNNEEVIINTGHAGYPKIRFGTDNTIKASTQASPDEFTLDLIDSSVRVYGQSANIWGA